MQTQIWHPMPLGADEVAGDIALQVAIDREAGKVESEYGASAMRSLMRMRCTIVDCGCGCGGVGLMIDGKAAGIRDVEALAYRITAKARTEFERRKQNGNGDCENG